MSDPKLKTAAVSIKYGATDGYRMEVIARGGPKTLNRHTGQPIPPENALLFAIDELARILALFGYGEQALAATMDAISRVKASREAA